MKTFFVVNFAVVRKSVITQVLNFALDWKIAGKLQNVEVVRVNTLTKKYLFYQIICWLHLTFILCSMLPRDLSKEKMPKAVIFLNDSGGSRTPATYKMELFVTLVNGFQFSAVN